MTPARGHSRYPCDSRNLLAPSRTSPSSMAAFLSGWQQGKLGLRSNLKKDGRAVPLETEVRRLKELIAALFTGQNDRC
jgi:hypothetical protein